MAVHDRQPSSAAARAPGTVMPPRRFVLAILILCCLTAIGLLGHVAADNVAAVDTAATTPAAVDEVLTGTLVRPGHVSRSSDGFPHRPHWGASHRHGKRSRQFSYTGVLNVDGTDVTNATIVRRRLPARGNCTLTEQQRSAAARNLVQQHGLSVLDYAGELSSSARNLADDASLIAASCVRVNSTHNAVRLTVSAATAEEQATALTRYSIGTVLHGESEEWDCQPNATNSANGNLTSQPLLAKVESTTIELIPGQSNRTILSIGCSVATYTDVFTWVNVTMMKPKSTSEASAASRSAATRSRRMENTQGASTTARRLENRFSATHDEADAFTDSDDDDLVPSVRRRFDQLSDVAGTWISPAAYQNFGVYDTVTASFYRASGFTDPTFTVEFYHFVVFLANQKLSSTSGTTYTGSCDATICSFTIPLLDFNGAVASLLPYYFEISGQCGFFGCHTSQSQYFMIPETFYQGQAFTPSSNPTFSKDCASFTSDSMCSAEDKSTGTAVLCALCSDGRDISVSVSCVDCTGSYSADVSVIQFAYDSNLLNPWGVVTVEADIAASAFLNVLATIKFDASYQGSFGIVKNQPVGYGESFTVAGVTISAGLLLDLNLLYEIDVSGELDVMMKTRVTDVMTVVASLDTTRSPKVEITTSRSSPIITKPTWSVNASAEVAIKLALQPAIHLTISHLFDIAVQTDIFVRAEADFQYPAFPALSGNYDTSLGVSHFHLGNCTTPHYLQYAITAGIENSNVSAVAVITIGSALLPGVTWFDYTSPTWTHALANDYAWPMMSGCLISAGTTAATAPTILQLPLKTTTPMSDAERIAFVYNILTDIANALNISASRLQVKLVDSDKQVMSVARTADAADTTRREQHLFAVSDVAAAQVTVLPGGGTSESSPATLQAQIVSAMATGGALAQSSSIGTSELMLSPEPTIYSSSSSSTGGHSSSGTGAAAGDFSSSSAGGVGILPPGDPTKPPSEPSSSPSSSSFPIGIVIGAAIGGVVVIGALASFVWWYTHRAGSGKAAKSTEPIMVMVDGSNKVVSIGSTAEVGPEVLLKAPPSVSLELARVSPSAPLAQPPADDRGTIPGAV